MKITREHKTQILQVAATVVVWCGALWPVAGRTATPAENLAPNPGFEGTQAHGWNLPKPPFTLSDEQPRSGAHCLKLENSDPKKYLLCSAHPKLTPGRSYEFEAWLRTQDVKGGDSGGATICIEWSDANGQFIGGCYPHGLLGTHKDWTRVPGFTGRIPTNAARFSVACYMRRTVTGTAWWDDVVIREFHPPVIEMLTTDRYRDQADGGRVTVHAGLALAENQLDAASVRLALTVLDPGGKNAATGKLVNLLADEAALEFDAAPLAPGAYTLRCTARNAAGVEIGHADLPFTRVAAFPPRKAFIDEHRRLILDGQPFFPLGTYWGGVKADELALYAKSPFNCIMPYADIGRAGVDLAWSNGIRVIYSVKDLYPGHKKIKTSAEARQVIAQKVTALRDHPGIIAWYINDELPLTMRDELVAHRQWLEKLDPGRPTWAVLYQVGQLRGYVPTCDVMGTDPYPIGRKPPVMARDWARESLRASLGAHAVWMVPQIFDWNAYHKTGDKAQPPRPPTLAEMRAMAWSCLAEGANGLIFYSWFDLWKMDKPKTVEGHTPAREPFDERWSDVTTMAAEIRDFVPMLLSIEPVAPPQVEASPDFAWRALAKDGATWLIAVNNDERANVTASFRFTTPFAKATARFPGAQPEGGGAEWKLTLPPLGVQCVRLER